MVNIHALITKIESHLNSTFAAIDVWFDKDLKLRQYKPRNGGWSINEVLEHIGLTNHFLMILIRKGTQKALANALKLNLQEALENYEFHSDQLTEVGLHQSFTWIRPAHMEPTGQKSNDEVRVYLKTQLNECLNQLHALKNGEGVLYKTTMTVNNLGKIDVYEYIYFLAQHGLRHITQMEKIETEYLQISTTNH